MIDLKKVKKIRDLYSDKCQMIWKLLFKNLWNTSSKDSNQTFMTDMELTKVLIQSINNYKNTAMHILIMDFDEHLMLNLNNKNLKNRFYKIYEIRNYKFLSFDII